MRGDPAGARGVAGILEATGMARRDSGDAGLALEGLASDGLIAGLEDGGWGAGQGGWTSGGSAGGGPPP